MSDIEKTISIIFSGKDDVSKTINLVTKNLGKIGDVAGSIIDPLAGVADGVLKVDAALTALAVAGLVYAFNKSKDFENATIELQKVLGGESDKIELAKENALSLSSVYGVASAEILSSTADFKQAGFDIVSAMDLVKNSLDLGIAGTFDSAEASAYLVKILKGFKAPASDAAEVIDILNEVSNNYATNVQELAEGMSILSPIAKQMGFSFAETAGVLTPVIEVFGSGSEAATALRTGLLKLIDDAKPVQEGLASIGISQKDANGQLKSGKEILLEVSKAFENLDQNQKLFITQQLVGINQSAKMVEVFDALGTVSEITAVALNSAGSAALEVAAKLAGSQAALDKFKVGFENLAIIVGSQFAKSAKLAIDGGTEIEIALQSIASDSTFKPLYDALDKAGVSIGTFLSAVAKSMPEAFDKIDFGGLLEAVGGLTDEFKEFFGSLDLTDPEDLAKGIQFIIDSVTSLVNVTAGMAESFKPVIDGIANFAKGFNALDESAQKGAGNILGAAKAVSEAGFIVIAAIMTIGQSAETVKKIFEVVGGGIKLVWNTLQVAFDTVAGWVVDGALLLNKALASVTFGDLSQQFKDNEKWLTSWLDAIKIDSAVQMGEALDGLSMALGKVGDESQTTIDIKKTPETDELIDWSKDPEIQKLIITDVDQAGLEKFNEAVPSKKEVIVLPKLDPEATKKIQDVIDKNIVKKLEIEASIDTAKIKAQAETIQTAMEWTAKLDIAEVEANAQKVTALAGVISDAYKSTGDTIASLFGTLASGDLGFSEKWAIEDAIKAEIKLREAQLVLQEKLTDAEIALMNEKTKKLKAGKTAIEIDGSGLAPHLEMIMWEVLEAIQVKANEEYNEFLLGI